MIDFHSHIIYDVDDGSENIEMSKIMLENSKNNGVEIICASSHYLLGRFEQEKEEYFYKLAQLQKLTDIQIVPSLEVRIDKRIIHEYEQGRIWGINYGSYMLLELPFTHIPSDTFDIIHELRIRGVKPILAHPERHPNLLKQPILVENFIDEKVLIQVNADSLLGSNGIKSKNMAKYLIQRNMVHMLGSDGHNITTRPTNVKAAYQQLKKLNPSLFQWIKDNQFSFINSEKVVFPKIINQKKGLLKGFLNPKKKYR